MKKIQIISTLVLMISIACLIIWRFAVPFPDWAVRVVGIFMLVSMFMTVFSTVKITAAKK